MTDTDLRERLARAISRAGSARGQNLHEDRYAYADEVLAELGPTCEWLMTQAEHYQERAHSAEKALLADRRPPDVFDAAMMAAFPGLPQCMTLDEAGRRVAAALNAAWPLIERHIRGQVADETGNDEGSAPKNGAHGTCATCGKLIEFIDPRDGMPGLWRHVQMPADHHAQLGGPA